MARPVVVAKRAQILEYFVMYRNKPLKEPTRRSVEIYGKGVRVRNELEREGPKVHGGQEDKKVG